MATVVAQRGFPWTCQSYGHPHIQEFVSAFKAENWAIYEDLCLAWNQGCRKLIVQSDSQTAIKVLSDSSLDHLGALV
ncbi:hypothetical protein RJT34_26606 [Clitoria ternatea]|uniref:RNase H type-1 domain-containing protein n=1 Tax=Clitoria ternatea TaxID=43366 RepID=A0AAN9F943_CLITE